MDWLSSWELPKESDCAAEKVHEDVPTIAERTFRGIPVWSDQGYANTISGLKRFRGHSGKPSHWEKNWLINHPVQGSAAVVFKATGNRLRKLYAQYDARIIIPLHDAFIFESRLECLKEVAELTAQVMCHTLAGVLSRLAPAGGGQHYQARLLEQGPAMLMNLSAGSLV